MTSFATGKASQRLLGRFALPAGNADEGLTRNTTFADAIEPVSLPARER